MTRDELECKIKALKDKWSAELGTLTDIWLHRDLLDILDPRFPLEKLVDPYKIGETYITPFDAIHKRQVRIAFLAEVDLGDDSNESVGFSGSASGSE
jgi:hypothetical protein